MRSLLWNLCGDVGDRSVYNQGSYSLGFVKEVFFSPIVALFTHIFTHVSHTLLHNFFITFFSVKLFIFPTLHKAYNYIQRDIKELFLLGSNERMCI